MKIQTCLKDLKTGSKRFDLIGENPKDRTGSSKVPLHLLPPAALAYTAEVLRHGAEKYGEFNWRTSRVRATVYVSAALRHLLRYLDGEDVDPDSGLPHAAHVMASMAILIDAALVDALIDDRNKTGKYGAVADSLTRQEAKHDRA